VFTSDGKVSFCQVTGKSIVAQQCSQVTQQFSGSMHIEAVSSLKDWPCRLSLTGESFGTSSSSGSSPCNTFVDICAKHVCPQTYHFLK
jgi:hypothetical protein